MSRTRARSFSDFHSSSVFLFLSLFLSRSLFLFILTCMYMPELEACTQPQLSGFALGNSLESISATHLTRCLIPVAATTTCPSSRQSVLSEYSPAPRGTPIQQRLSPPTHVRTHVTSYTINCMLASMKKTTSQNLLLRINSK